MEPNEGTLVKTPTRPNREAAEHLAIAALGFIAEEPRRLDRFLAESGIAPDRIRRAAHEPGFLAGILEHMLGDETLLLAFAAYAGIDPAEVMRARHTLGGVRDFDMP